MNRVVGVCLGVVVLLTLAGCGDDQSKTVSLGTAGDYESPSPNVMTPSVSTQSPKPRPTKHASPARRVTGYGATLTDWRSAHQVAPGFAADSAFLPLIGDQPKYFAVQASGYGDVAGDPPASPSKEVVLNYSIAFDHGTSQSEAVSEALAQFPPDAHIAGTSNGDGTCKQYRVRSAIVEQRLAAFHYKGEVAFFELSGADGGPFDSGNVSEAILAYTPRGEFPGC